MKAILLAAGRGTRISKYIQDTPKSALFIYDESLIHRNAKHLLDLGFEVIVCVGYKEEVIRECLKDCNVKFFYNPFYAVTNSIGSLWFAKDELNDDCVIMNADVFIDFKIMDEIIKQKDITLSVDKTTIETGDYFFTLDNDGCVKRYGKDIPLEDRTVEYVGIAYIPNSYLKAFKKQLEEHVHYGNYNLWWENTLYSMADKGDKIHTLDVNGLFWSEIDFYDDYERILKYVKEKK